MRNFLSNILIISILAACGPMFTEKHTITPASNLILLLDKSESYNDLINQRHLDSYGFLVHAESLCDSLLFTGLYGASLPSDDTVHIEAAREITEDGQVIWYRHPSKTCGPSQNTSRSTISRDMIIGLYWYMWKHQRLDLALELMLDLQRTHYKLRGEGTLGELQLTPEMVNTLALLIEGLGGPSFANEKLLPVFFDQDVGFVAHLTVWHILLRGEIRHGLSYNEKSVLEGLAIKEPTNPLFQAAAHKYVDGNYENAVQLLLDRSQWPEDRLPTTAEHCGEWPIQRSTSANAEDWLPCSSSPLIEHTGAELPTILRLIISPL